MTFSPAPWLAWYIPHTLPMSHLVWPIDIPWMPSQHPGHSFEHPTLTTSSLPGCHLQTTCLPCGQRETSKSMTHHFEPAPLLQCPLSPAYTQRPSLQPVSSQSPQFPPFLYGFKWQRNLQWLKQARSSFLPYKISLEVGPQG